jgi:glycerol-3-phosphate cytidylyltransferase
MDNFSTLLIPFSDRSAIVESIKYVDRVIPENDWNQKASDIEKYNVDCFVIGADWEGKFDFLKEKCDVIYLPRTDGISTSLLKERLK